MLVPGVPDSQTLGRASLIRQSCEMEVDLGWGRPGIVEVKKAACAGALWLRGHSLLTELEGGPRWPEWPLIGVSRAVTFSFIKDYWTGN